MQRGYRNYCNVNHGHHRRDNRAFLGAPNDLLTTRQLLKAEVFSSGVLETKGATLQCVPLKAYVHDERDAEDIAKALCDGMRYVRALVERSMMKRCLLCKIFATDTGLHTEGGLPYVDMRVAFLFGDISEDETAERLALAIKRLKPLLEATFHLEEAAFGDPSTLRVPAGRLPWCLVASGRVHDLVVLREEMQLQSAVLLMAKNYAVVRGLYRSEIANDDDKPTDAFFIVHLCHDAFSCLDDACILPPEEKKGAKTWIGDMQDAISERGLFPENTLCVVLSNGEREKGEVVIRSAVVCPSPSTPYDDENFPARNYNIATVRESHAFFAKEALSNFFPVAGVEYVDSPPDGRELVEATEYIA